jgi:release factor glutamine methyltransferase
MLKKRKDLVGGVDLCCGTGCIGITIKKHCPWVDMTLVDINKKAISNTTHNAKLNKVNVKTITGGFYQSLIKRKLKFDFIVCNPPYVDIKALDKSMTKYETKISFVNSPHSLDFYKTIIKNMSKLVNKHGFVAFEIGYDQKPQLEKLLANKEHSFYKDLNGNDRLLIIYC